MNILLISTYELGRQPFGLASPAAWLREAGHEVRCQDLSQEKLDAESVREAELVCFYLPMHTATRIAVRVIERVKQLNPPAHVCCYGLYAPLNAELLRSFGVEAIIGGEFEAALVELARQFAHNWGQAADAQDGNRIHLERLRFRVPDRSGLPELARYAKLRLPDGSTRVVGYSEASRGCLHRCRHCPIVPVYDGAFRIVQREVVLEDIRRQVAAGAEHITFGDPDFFNGVGHSMAIVEALHREFPSITYDVTSKIEHLLRYSQHLRVLRETGCAFVISAVESVDDPVLRLLEKGHTRADFVRAVELMRRLGLPLTPTFIPFTPWTTLGSYADLLRAIAELDLVEQVPPVQLSIRLLIPSRSKLLEIPELRDRIGEFDRNALSYRWASEDSRVDELQREIETMVQEQELLGSDRASTFKRACDLLNRKLLGSETSEMLRDMPPRIARAAIPYLTEPWYC